MNQPQKPLQNQPFQTATVNLQNIAWTIKSLTVDSPSDTSSELTYQTKTDLQIRNDLKAISLDLQVMVSDAHTPQGKPLAHLVLGLAAGITGLESFVQGNQANIPNDFIHQLVIMMSHTARGILMNAGRGTALERFPLPLFNAEQLSSITPNQTIN